MDEDEFDPIDETLLPLRAAARRLPRGRGRPVHFSTVLRWINVGRRLRGQTVRLEAVRMGGVWVVSQAALGRFFASLTALSRPAADGQGALQVGAASVTQTDVERLLDGEGFGPTSGRGRPERRTHTGRTPTQGPVAPTVEDPTVQPSSKDQAHGA